MCLSGWVGVGFGGNCDCRCVILYAPMLGRGMVFAGLVSLTSSSYPLLVRKFSKPEDGRYRTKHVVFSMANKHHHLAIYL